MVELVIRLCGEIGKIVGVDGVGGKALGVGGKALGVGGKALGVGAAFGVAVLVCGSIGEARFGRIVDTSLW